MATPDSHSDALARSISATLETYRNYFGLSEEQVRNLVMRKTGLRFTSRQQVRWTTFGRTRSRRVNPLWIGKETVGLWELIESLQAWPIFLSTLAEELPHTLSTLGPDGRHLVRETTRPRQEEPPVSSPVPYEIRLAAYYEAAHQALYSTHWPFEAIAEHVRIESGRNCTRDRLQFLRGRVRRKKRGSPTFFGGPRSVGLWHVITITDRWHFLIHETRHQIACRLEPDLPLRPVQRAQETVEVEGRQDLPSFPNRQRLPISDTLSSAVDTFESARSRP